MRAFVKSCECFTSVFIAVCLKKPSQKEAKLKGGWRNYGSTTSCGWGLNTHDPSETYPIFQKIRTHINLWRVKRWCPFSYYSSCWDFPPKIQGTAISYKIFKCPKASWLCSLCVQNDKATQPTYTRRAKGTEHISLQTNNKFGLSIAQL